MQVQPTSEFKPECRIGFWNIQGKSGPDSDVILTEFVVHHNLDILCIAEPVPSERVGKENLEHKREKVTQRSQAIATEINGRQIGHYRCIHANSRISVLSRLTDDHVSPAALPLRSLKYWLALRVRFPGGLAFNLFAVHFPSKLRWSDTSQAFLCTSMMRDVERHEEDLDFKNTILIGDFNMNPFESGMVARNGLNAHPDLSAMQAANGYPSVDATRYRPFYNPMWRFFGDQQTPFGSYYFTQAKYQLHAFEWNIFDQVLIRPELAPHIQQEDFVSIVTQLGIQSLAKNVSEPDEKILSDHFPLAVKLYL